MNKVKNLFFFTLTSSDASAQKLQPALRVFVVKRLQCETLSHTLTLSDMFMTHFKAYLICMSCNIYHCRRQDSSAISRKSVYRFFKIRLTFQLCVDVLS